MNASRTIKLLSLSVTVFVLIISSGCQYILPQEEQPLAPPLIEAKDVKYTTAEAKKGDITSSLQGVGRFESVKMADVYFTQGGGRIKDIKVKIGDMVKKGDVLVELDTGELDYDLEVARMQLTIQENNFKEFKRHSHRATEVQNAELELKIARLGVERLEQQKDDAKLRSPIDGQVVNVTTLKIGSSVDAYAPLATIGDQSQIMLTYIDDTNRDSFQIGMKVQVSLSSGPKCEGKIVSTPFDRDNGDPANVDKTVYVKVPDDFLKTVKVGDEAKLTLVLAERKGVLVLPKNAVKTYLQRRFVQVLENGVRVEKDVKVGLETSTECEILEGIQEGDQVIIR